MKVLQVIPTLDRSGAEKQMTLLAGGLPKDEFETAVCTLTRSGPYADELHRAGVPLFEVGKKHRFSLLAYNRLKNVIREFRPDIVHTWIFAANAYGRRAAVACGVPKIVCGERCVDRWKQAWHFAVDRMLAKKTDVIAVNSAGVRDFYVARGFPESLFEIIPNAVTPLLPSPVTKEELIRKLGLPIEPGKPLPLLIGLVARLWPQKRVRDAIWSAEQLKFTGLDFHMLILGDGPERENLLRYRDEIRIFDRVHFLGHRDDVYAFMPHFDLLWSVSAYEGLSNTVMEAMSVGVPVIASDITGHRELVVPGGTGVLISEYGGDPVRRRTAFCRESYALLQPDATQHRQAMGQAARRRIETQFGLSQMIERYARLYRSLSGQ
jgi:glycosyltransferase involved in cell wall biosynthesis